MLPYRIKFLHFEEREALGLPTKQSVYVIIKQLCLTLGFDFEITVSFKGPFQFSRLL